MKLNRLFKTVLLAIMGGALCAATTMAQDSAPLGPPNSPTPGAQDPPGRVARLQYMDGQVSIQPGGVDDWVEAAMNRPLTSADRIWTDKQSRAELGLGTAVLRMDSETSLTLTNVADSSVQLQLDQGELSVTVFRMFDGQIYEVDTPNIAFTITKPGEYRFDVLPDNDQTWVTVRKGQGEATGQGKGVRVSSGEQVRFTNGTSMVHTAEAAPARDPFDDWVKVRNKREENSVSARYVSPGVIGYEDLDNYGTWQTVPTYGAVWYPSTVAVGWAPYRYGHWVWIAPWGWTWVDDAPWGFAPFHYGRWVWWGGAWGWCPGPVMVGVPAVYAPALVAWFGGPRFGIGIGFGGIGVGWFPLGWGEPFVPWYHYGPHYFRRVNITNTRITNFNVVNVRNINYANRAVAGAVTAAPASAFAAGRNLHGAAVSVPAAALQHGQVMRTAQVAPGRESVLGGHAPLSRGVPPARAFSRPVVTRQTPPPRPPSFSSQQPLLAKNNGVPLDHNTLNNLRQQQGANLGPASQLAPNRGSTPAPGGAGNGNRNASGNVATNGRYVPRPPERGVSPGQAGSTGRNVTPGTRTVPRPPEGGVSTASPRTAPTTPQSRSSVPAPSATPQGRSTAPSPSTAPTAKPGPYSQPQQAPQQHQSNPPARVSPGSGGGPRGAAEFHPAPQASGNYGGYGRAASPGYNSAGRVAHSPAPSSAGRAPSRGGQASHGGHRG
jgi:hypothetical protein